MSVKVMTFLFIGAIIFITETPQFETSTRELSLKLISLKLNIRPYNRLSVGTEDFKDDKDELGVPHITKSSY